MINKRIEWKLVLLVSNGRIHTGRYKLFGERLTVEYAGLVRSENCNGKEVVLRQAENLLRKQ
jgi:hypothetical protein